jgi:hypothetical protein
MEDGVEQVEDYIGEVKEFLYDRFDIDESDRESIGEVNIVSADEFYASTDGKAPMSAGVGENGEDCIIVNNELISDTDYEVTETAVGEEVAHIILQNTAQSIQEYLGVSSDTDLDFDLWEWTKYNTVTEMVGRSGAVYTAIHFDSELDEAEHLEGLQEYVADSGQVPDLGVKTILNMAAHEAGYNAAYENIEEVASGETTIMNKSVEKIWDDYELINYVKRVLNELPTELQDSLSNSVNSEDNSK